MVLGMAMNKSKLLHLLVLAAFFASVGALLFVLKDSSAPFERWAVRSHYTGCVYDCRGKASPASLLEQLAASVNWNRSPGDHWEE